MRDTLENTWYEADDDRGTNLVAHEEWCNAGTGENYTVTHPVSGDLPEGTRVYYSDDAWGHGSDDYYTV